MVTGGCLNKLTKETLPDKKGEDGLEGTNCLKGTIRNTRSRQNESPTEDIGVEEN